MDKHRCTQMALIRFYPCPSVVLLVDMQVYFKSGFMAIFWNRSTSIFIKQVSELACKELYIGLKQLNKKPVA